METHVVDGVKCLTRQLAAANAVIERLPKTKDGAWIFLGMTLWRRWVGATFFYGSPAISEVTVLYMQWSMRSHQVVFGVSEENEELDGSDCYSTRDALEADAAKSQEAKP